MKTLLFYAGILAVALFPACESDKLPVQSSISKQCRVIVCPTFDAPTEHLIQLDRAGIGMVTEFRYSGKGGYSPRRINRPKVIKTEVREIVSFFAELERLSLTDLPTKQPYMTALDGTTASFEIELDGESVNISRWLCEKTEDRFISALKAWDKLTAD